MTLRVLGHEQESGLRDKNFIKMTITLKKIVIYIFQSSSKDKPNSFFCTLTARFNYQNNRP